MGTKFRSTVLLAFFLIMLSALGVRAEDQTYTVIGIEDASAYTAVLTVRLPNGHYSLAVEHLNEIRPLWEGPDMAAISNDGSTVFFGYSYSCHLWKLDVTQDPWVLQEVINCGERGLADSWITEIYPSWGGHGLYMAVNYRENQQWNAGLYWYDTTDGGLTEIATGKHIEELNAGSDGVVFTDWDGKIVQQKMFVFADGQTQLLNADMANDSTRYSTMVSHTTSIDLTAFVPKHATIVDQDYFTVIYSVMNNGVEYYYSTNGSSAPLLVWESHGESVRIIHWRYNDYISYLVLEGEKLFAVENDGFNKGDFVQLALGPQLPSPYDLQ